MVLQWRNRVPHLAVSLGCVDFKADICLLLANGFSWNYSQISTPIETGTFGVVFWDGGWISQAEIEGPVAWELQSSCVNRLKRERRLVKRKMVEYFWLSNLKQPLTSLWSIWHKFNSRLLVSVLRASRVDEHDVSKSSYGKNFIEAKLCRNGLFTLKGTQSLVMWHLALRGGWIGASSNIILVYFPYQTPHQPSGQPFKFTVADSCDRIKEEFNFLQAQYHK